MTASSTELNLTLATSVDEATEFMMALVALKLTRDPSESLMVAVVVGNKHIGRLSHKVVSIESCMRVLSQNDLVRSLEEVVLFPFRTSTEFPW